MSKELIIRLREAAMLRVGGTAMIGAEDLSEAADALEQTEAARMAAISRLCEAEVACAVTCQERDALAAELKGVRVTQQAPTTDDINLQNWKGMDGACAWHIIDRHADDWNHVARLMNAWLEANREDLVSELKALREQEPKAYVTADGKMIVFSGRGGDMKHLMTPLYAHPVPARELTDEVIGQIYIKEARHIEHATQREIAFARAIERHLKG